jgi:hypothetical protein
MGMLACGIAFAEADETNAGETTDETGAEKTGAGQAGNWCSGWKTDTRWYIGVYAGYANNTVYMGGGDKIEYFKEYRAGHGWTIGIPVRYQIFTWLGVQVEPTFITKNYSMHQTGAHSKLYDEFTNSFVDFPILLHFKLNIMNTGLSLFANGGWFLGVFANAHRRGKALAMTSAENPGDLIYHDYNEDYTFDDRYDSRFDGGLLGGLGVQYDLKPVSFYIEWRYNYSLSDLHKQMQRNQTPYMNDTWTIHAGVLFNYRILDIFKEAK